MEIILTGKWITESYSERIGIVLYYVGFGVSEFYLEIKVTQGINTYPLGGPKVSNHGANTTIIAYNPEDVKPTRQEISSKPSRQGSRR
jgi:hypothetical protein